ncbi:MAG: hypothetical protein WC661_02815 [Opitutaceae bacterium]
MFLGNIFRFADLLGEAHVEKQVDLLLAGRDGGLSGCGGSLLGGGRGVAFLFECGNHRVGDGGFEGHLPDAAINLIRDGLLPNVFLRAGGDSFCASEVVVALLRLGRYSAAALAAPEEAAIQVGFEFWRLGLALAGHDGLHLVEEAFGDDGVVRSLEQLAVREHHAVVKRVLEEGLIIGGGEPLAGVCEEPDPTHPLAHLVQGVVARGV